MTNTYEELIAIVSDEEITKVHGYANFGSMTPREAVNDGVRKTAVGYHCGHTQFTILREHGLITRPRPGSYDANLTKKGKAYARVLYHVEAARLQAAEARARAAEEALKAITETAPSLPKSFQWTGTDRAEDLFDAELRHASGKTPVDYLRAWLNMFRPFAYATRDDSWGELEKLISIAMNRVVKTYAAIDAARALTPADNAKEA
jgi:hypothetical protein